MLSIIFWIVWFGCLVCAIAVLVKLFQTEGALKGILGLICGLYTYIWGWINANRLGIRNIMLIWTVLIIVLIILNFMGAASMFTMPTTTTP
jgi:hypothetical protein